VFSIHTHETATGGQEHLTPNRELDSPEFLRKLHRDAIDSGADIAITHGPHALRGIEIYKGRPIFYSLGSLFFSVGANWPDDWYDSALAITRFAGGAVSEIRIYPLRIRAAGDAAQRSHAGAPRLAKGADARRILKALQDYSSQYGTRIVIENDVGVIRVKGS
jgi:poly-gamma-glutamate capsule biosynthesis protein CapA/YwtB (metallophosphatase superfamily)